jgi:hypothetical protein
MTDAKPADLVALSMAVKGKALTDAKQAVADGTATPVHLVAELIGTLARGKGKPAVEGTQTASVSLASYEVMLAVLVKLGIGEARLQAALDHVTEHVRDGADAAELGFSSKAERLNKVVVESSIELSDRLPAVPVTRAATSGRLSFDVESLTFHESLTCSPSKIAA